MATPKKENPQPAGRKTKYKPEYCEQIIELGKIGKLPVQVAVAFGISKPTLFNWCDEFPEFFNAFTEYKAIVEDFFVNLNFEHASEDRPGNAGTAKFLLMAAFDGWREKSENKTDVTSKGDAISGAVINVIQPGDD